MMATLGTFVAGQVLTAAELNAIGTATAFTPTWTNLTVGNATVDANYWQINELVFWQVQLTFGSTTSITGSIAIQYPVAGPSSSFLGAVGGSVSFDDATGTDYVGILYRNNTTIANISVLNSGGTYVSPSSVNATVPFTWTTGDVITIEDWYAI